MQTSPFTLKVKIKAKLWSVINSTVYRYSPFFFRKFRVALVKAFGGKIEWSCSLDRRSRIDHPWNLIMGDLSSLGEDSWAYCLDKILIGEKCCIGKDVYLLTGSHDVSTESFDLLTRPIKIKSNTWIATGCYILPGVELGSFNVVAAGSVVTKSFDDNCIVGGNPAKYIKDRSIKQF
ncbi:hypothetical protein PKOR_00700 [Pontibacter korlensis]|uniref:Acetyltransferase n=1 Tax=Pontibacter korlensis TaxID=400092 RepID=A0A0E3ZII7_9BACT|nr:hypothetical protein PKOR_00700 [Pontibacter korlensis]